MSIPAQIRAGINAIWSDTSSYVDQGYSFQYLLIGESKIVIDAIVENGLITVNENAGTTSAWLAGEYRWYLFAFSDQNKHEVCTGRVRILPNLENIESDDVRSHAEIMLDAIKQILAGRVQKDVESYTTEDGRQLTKIPIVELVKMEKRYNRLVRRERNKANGKSNFVVRPVKVRLGNAR